MLGNIQALSLAGDFPACELTLQWATQVKAAAPVSGTEDGRKLSQSSDVIPDEERAPDQRVTPAALLASIGDVEVLFRFSACYVRSVKDFILFSNKVQYKFLKF